MSELSRELLEFLQPTPGTISRTIDADTLRKLVRMAESWRAHCEAGRVSVPREPTEAMWDAAWKSIGLPYRAKLSLHEIKTLFDKFHAAMLSAAPAPAATKGWQPIETAPKDGVRIILFWSGEVVSGFYLDNSKSLAPWVGFRTMSGEKTPPGKPSLWQPFPPAPSPDAPVPTDASGLSK